VSVQQPQETALYRKFDIAARPGMPFAMLSCEADADATDKLIGKAYIATTWPDYPGAWRHADLSSLVGRQGLLIPDATSDAHQDMRNMAARLLEIGCTLRWTDTSNMPPDWSPADWQDTPEAFIAWAKARTADYVPPAEPDPEPVEPPTDDFPPEATLTERPKRQKPRLAAVDGNTALAPEADAEPLPQAFSDDALADHFAEKHCQSWRYVDAWGWFKWDGDGWRKDDTNEYRHLARMVTRDALHWLGIGDLTAKDRRKLNSAGSAGNLVSIAKSDRRLVANVDQWDTDSWLLGVPGGVIDLRSAKMLPAEPEQYLTKRCAAAPDHGTPELWLEYLKRAHQGDEEVISFLQRFAGYCCTGETTEHALAFLYGTGRNGKGVFLETISGVLGDYARTAAMETFLEQRNPQHTTELARLHKARLVITEEVSSGGRWNEARIKHMTGGGKITARFMRLDDFEFTPNFKLMIAANHKPSLRSVDEAMKARIHLVPFEVTIPPEERDLNLLDKLRAEWPQILGWMLDGCAQWQERGLKPPEKVRSATTKYMDSEDILGDWIAECCLLEGELDGADGYKNYSRWCEAQGYSAWSRIGWSKALLERGTVDDRRSNGRTIFIGISLKPGAALP
jgi:P4 family phage/plasmid primase-like protien